MLIKRSERQARRGKIASELSKPSADNLNRRSFLRRSGLTAGSLAALGSLPLASIRQAEAGPPPPPGAIVTTRKNFCTHCSVGCSVIAEVANGVWIGQEPDYDSPINRGSHCCKGAAVRDDVPSMKGRHHGRAQFFITGPCCFRYRSLEARARSQTFV
jgi:formate dehydrogenase major subunit